MISVIFTIHKEQSMSFSIKKFFGTNHKPKLTAIDFFKYIGPGFLVTIGFIDPGNWASNVSAGSDFGYKLLWVITISTIMLIILQHNVAHLGIVTGYCLSEASTIYLRPWISKMTLITAVLASISTAFAEILGGAIALDMLFKLPVKIGSLLILVFVSWMLFTSSYKKIEKWIICFVSLIGLSFIIELSMVHIEWNQALTGWTVPTFPLGAMPIIMSALGAVVMPHNLYLHSEIIQSKQWNLEDEHIIAKQLDYEFMDTLLSMLVGWAINSAIIIIAAATFFANKVPVTELGQAHQMLIPLLGNSASVIFAVSLLFSGVSSCITAGMAGGSIFAGLFKEPYDIHDAHTKLGVAITLVAAFIVVLLIQDPFKGLVYSQVLLSIQLPITIFTQIYLTSSKKVMGKYANKKLFKILLWCTGIFVTILNIMLFISLFKNV